MNPQQRAVLTALRESPVTQRDATRQGITRLAARVYDLREQGYVIASEMVPVNSRWKSAKVARYVLVKEPKAKA